MNIGSNGVNVTARRADRIQLCLMNAQQFGYMFATVRRIVEDIISQTSRDHCLVVTITHFNQPESFVQTWLDLARAWLRVDIFMVLQNAV